MRLSCLVVATLFAVLFTAAVSHAEENKRFFITDFIPDKFKREECILCNCYHECHAAQFHFSEKDICSSYHDFDCAHIDRCTCCNDLALGTFFACQNGGTCHNVGNGNFTCTCPPHVTGDRCEHRDTSHEMLSPTNHCAGNPCWNGATCTDRQTDFSCTCAPGFTGTTCQQTSSTVTVTNHCSGVTCGNGGTCVNSQTGYTCLCTASWTGNNCNTAVTVPQTNHCANSPCQNGGTCRNDATTYSCQCTTDWTGRNCTVKVTLPACDHTCSLEAVIKSQSVSIITASVCPGTTVRTSTEALPIKCCSLGIPASWHQNLKVMSNCSKLSGYKPVAKYINGVLDKDASGIFTDCLTGGDYGFQMITQSCTSPPHLVTISSSNGDDPDSYFAVF